MMDLLKFSQRSYQPLKKLCILQMPRTLLGQLVDDMGNNCSYEVFEAQWNGLTERVKGLSGFFESHQKALQSLQDACPDEFDTDEVDEA